MDTQTNRKEIMREQLSNPIPGSRKLWVVGESTAPGEFGAGELSSMQLAHRIGELAGVFWTSMEVSIIDTAGAVGMSKSEIAEEITAQIPSKVVFWLPEEDGSQSARIFRQEGVAGMNPRKDIFLVGVSATRGATGEEQYNQGLQFVKENSANLALAYDQETRNSMIVAPEETTYDESLDLDTTLRGLMEMVYFRSQLTFTRSTVVGGEPVDWNSELVYPTLREVVDFCIDNGAYKPFLGVTAGHFAAMIASNEFLTSRRKTNFNNLDSTGLVKVTTDGEDRVVAMGGKPSVGGQSQRIVFEDHPERDSIVHFHCPIKEGSNVPIVSQREYECGSHECGQNTSDGLTVVDDGIEAVYLDNHGPNVVFHHDEDPNKINEFLMDNFDFSKKTGGYQLNRG